MPKHMTRSQLPSKTRQTNKPVFNPSSFDAVVAGRQISKGDTCLLLDISYSMEGEPVVKLRDLADEFPDTPRICFDSRVEVLQSYQQIPNPRGSTALDLGIAAVHIEGYKAAVLITDGRPNDPMAALLAARRTGIKLDIVFVGSGLAPQFLKDLADVCGGTFQKGDLRDTTLLAEKVTGLLGSAEPTKGPIIL